MGGDILSMDWNVPLNREVCLDEVAEEAADDVAVDAPFDTLVSIGYLLPMLEGLEPSISTTISGAFPEIDLPSSAFLASSAPAGDRNLTRADRVPDSSGSSVGRNSMSTTSLEKTSIRRSDSSEVTAGRLWITAEDSGAAGAAEKGDPTGLLESRS